MPRTHLRCLPPSFEMKAVRPLEVTESVTTVVPGCSRSVTAAMSAMKRLLLISRPAESTIAHLGCGVGGEVGRVKPRGAMFA